MLEVQLRGGRCLKLDSDGESISIDGDDHWLTITEEGTVLIAVPTPNVLYVKQERVTTVEPGAA